MPLRKPVPDPNAHLKPQLSDFGLKRMPVLVGSLAYGGKVEVGEDEVGVRVSESSGGTPAIWLKVEDEGRAIIVLLTLTRATQLAAQLDYLVEHHHTKETP